MFQSGALGWILGTWFAAIGFLIAYRILTGHIGLRGILTRGAAASGPQGGAGKFSPERAQLLVVTLGGLAAYVATALSQQQMPEFDSSVLAIFAFSHAVYLGGKAARR